ncbi:ATP-binding protein [Geotoga petraea]|jgi:anti-sigma regulatory factor (Ser/Thr protein kinase)|uniref:ATP-binding protein n=1 Tax=Geotoga petraea TaxID=28234 RepID=A0A1G6I9I5_9BACT|nr:ATP-binding protein [Geotoga petraea]MDK2945512.1 serine/threonine-protein kinase RsbW [Geotoga sp.]TGG89133.1 ATP-binding protein [Geotoga petraea]SDC03100.1 Anti-sigma regulatory factor (Ser/Thr protein kinase) [Geotoga petraea]
MNYELKLTQPKKLIEDIDNLKKSIKNISEDIFFKLEIILDELGSNSIKYADNSVLHIKDFEDHLKIEVYSQGGEIPPFYIDIEDTKKLVEKCIEEGHGLGLHLVKNLADHFEYEYYDGKNKIIVKLKKDG